jgi:hypothetical protein
MEWTEPPTTDVLMRMRIPHGGEPPCHLQIDKLPDGFYRTTAGALVLCRTSDLAQLLRHAHRLGVCRSFREVLTVLQQLSALDGGGRASPSAQARDRIRSAGARGHNRDRRGAAAGALGRRFWPVKLRPGSGLARWL